MTISDAGLALIKRFESCKLTAYPDPKTGGAPWTVGWGSTGPDIGPGTVWTQEEADERLLDDVSAAEAQVDRYVKAPMTQGQRDAFVSIFFNVGPGSASRDGIGRLRNGNPSTLVRKFMAGDLAATEAEWLKWVSPGSAVENGLRRRRLAELELFRSA